jgi:hypothetical protein
VDFNGRVRQFELFDCRPAYRSVDDDQRLKCCEVFQMAQAIVGDGRSAEINDRGKRKIGEEGQVIIGDGRSSQRDDR